MIMLDGGITVYPGDRPVYKTRICIEVPAGICGTTPFWTNNLREACTLFELAVRRVRKRR